MRIADRLRAFADLLDELDAKPSRFAAAGDEKHVVISFNVDAKGCELVTAINQPHARMPRQSLLFKVEAVDADKTPERD